MSYKFKFENEFTFQSLLTYRNILKSRMHEVEIMSPASCAHLLNITYRETERPRGNFVLLPLADKTAPIAGPFACTSLPSVAPQPR